MRSFKQIVADVLRQRGPMEIRALVRAASKLESNERRATEDQLIQSILTGAITGEVGLTVIEYPAYRLRNPLKSVKLPPGKYARAALLALKGSNESIALPSLARSYGGVYCTPTRCPEFWMWRALATEVTGAVVRSGHLCVGLMEAARSEQGKRTPLKNGSTLLSGIPGPIGQRIGEKSLETLLANSPDLIEPGLTLFQRQCRIPVGIIDLLFVDGNRNYIVVEIKRPSADYREVVGQITTYMGWVRKNVAKSGQTVRGIIVVGKLNEKLAYSLDQVRDVSVRTFF